ncbi:MAG: hypothetical protein ACU0A8_07525 [Limimaricola soesokkakensis]|uniref:hypothetical protein n=1 Tax=Limimaricola soesokkakensis TaxID=1343159 RepID=UPI004057E31B
MVYGVRRGPNLDLELIFDFIAGRAKDLGEAPQAAFEIASRRIVGIEHAREGLGCVPH